MSALDRATAALGNANVRAFLRVIREGESGQDDDAYRIMYGGEHFAAPPWAHPFDGIPTTQGAKASGAYQFLGTTWRRCADALGLSDFSPISQDIAAVHLIDGRGALGDVESGNLVSACAKLKDEWVSLPGLGLERVQRVFLQYGGSYAGAPPADTAQPKGKAMAPLLFLPAILEAIPSLIALFGKGERAQTNAKAAEVVVQAFTKAVPGAANAQDAIEKVQSDPALAKDVEAAVKSDPTVMALLEIGGGVAQARRDNIALMSAADRPWKVFLNPVLIVTALLLPLVYMIVYKLMAEIQYVSSDVVSQTIGTIVGLVLGSITGFWMGMTYQQTGGNNQRRAADAQQ